MMDIDDGYILWTGIWKGTISSLPFPSAIRLTPRPSSWEFKRPVDPPCGSCDADIGFAADIVKMIDSQPDLAPLIRRVRGGYLKIQGTWMPYEVCCDHPILLTPC